MSGFFARLKSGLSKSSQALGDSLSFMSGKKLSADQLDALEDALIMADLGVATAGQIVDNLRARRDLADLDEAGLRAILADEITALLDGVEKPFRLPDEKPAVILMAGVNGAGKTTTIGKLAKKFMADGKSVMLAAGDTFRAAAGEQLQVWGERAGVPVVVGAPGSDAASLAYQALERAKAEAIDVLLIDTAGRLQSNDNLMAELEKITRVIGKLDAAAPHESLLVLDATTGQKRHCAGRGVFTSGKNQRSGDDQAGRHGARRRAGGDCAKISPADLFYRRRRAGRGFAKFRGGRFCPSADRGRGRG